MKHLLLIACLSIWFETNAQNCDLCMQLSISGNHKTLSIDSLRFYKLTYSITNCSDFDIQIDADDFPQSEGMGNIYFHVVSVSNGKITHYDLENDGNATDIGKTKILHSKDKHDYVFNLFNFYNINSPGNYHIEAYYMKKLFDKNMSYRGAYVQDSNPIELKIR